MAVNPDQTLYIVDAHAFLHRAYHALPKLSTSKGEEVGALFGFARVLAKILREKKPAYMTAAFDFPAKNFRHELFPAYKQNRPPTDAALVGQLRLAPEVASAMGIKTYALEGAEADDLIASLTRRAARSGLSVVVVSADKDIYQLVGPDVSVWPSMNEDLRGEAFVRQKYGLSPSQLGDYFALVGDSSDNIPGVDGIGPKAATKLLGEFGSLEKILAAARSGDPAMTAGLAEKINRGSESALLSRKLVALNEELLPEVNFDELIPRPPAEGQTPDLFRRLEFRDFQLPSPARITAPAVTSALIGFEEALLKAKGGAAVFIACADGYGALGFEDATATVFRMDGLEEGQLASIKSIVLDAGVLKVGHDIKAILREWRVELPLHQKLNCFDTALAAWCLDPSRPYANMEELAADMLAVSSPEGDAQAALLAQAHTIWELKNRLAADLEAKGLLPLFSALETPLIPVLARMETAGLHVDKAILTDAGRELDRRAAQLAEEINKAGNTPVNPNSPKQVAFLLYEKLGIKAGRKTKTGYSTDEDTLRKISACHPVVESILQFRECAKLKSTYVDGLLALADQSTGRVHTVLDQFGTATGRLSSSKPNLQNIPVRSDYGKVIRRAFTVPAGQVLVSADYSQIDLRVLAHESGDEALVAAFRNDEDIHLKTACEVFGVMAPMVTKDMRRQAKAINFGIVYGQTGMGLASLLDIPRAEAQQYIEHYFTTYPGVRKWIDATVEKAKAAGFVKTLAGRVRYFPEFQTGNINAVNAGARAAVNTVIQGGSADVIKLAMLKVEAALPASFPARMVLQVHDELLFECDAARAAELGALVKSAMESACDLRVPLLVAVKAGENWQEMSPLGSAA